MSYRREHKREAARVVKKRVSFGELFQFSELSRTIWLTKNAGRAAPRRFLFSSFSGAIVAAERIHNGGDSA